MSPWPKKVCFGFNSMIVLPSPAFARKAAESNVMLLSLVKMLPRCRPVLWPDGSCPGTHRRFVLGLGLVANGSKAVNAVLKGIRAHLTMRPDAGNAGPSSPLGSCAKRGLLTPRLTAITINLCLSSPGLKNCVWSILLYRSGLSAKSHEIGVARAE